MTTDKEKRRDELKKRRYGHRKMRRKARKKARWTEKIRRKYKNKGVTSIEKRGDEHRKTPR